MLQLAFAPHSRIPLVEDSDFKDGRLWTANSTESERAKHVHLIVTTATLERCTVLLNYCVSVIACGPNLKSNERTVARATGEQSKRRVRIHQVQGLGIGVTLL